MKNIDIIITAHNRRVISQDTTAQPECNRNRKKTAHYKENARKQQ